jgi:predicted N-acetyltransferase YhbS
VIRAARPSDIPALRELERVANALFLDLGMAAVADFEPTSATELADMIADQRAWVWADDADQPVASLVFSLVDGNAHIEQVAVHPVYGRRGLGRQLLEKACELAAGRGLGALTLTTFAEVPWNAPYYARLGFEVLDDGQLTPGERAIRDRNDAGPLGAWPRVTMRRNLSRPAAQG